jgi:hypothetical protein
MVSIPWNDDGLFDGNGMVTNVEIKLHTKYAMEARFSISLAAVKLFDGALEGHRCKNFDYSEKPLITLTMWEEMEQKEMRIVTTLKREGNGFRKNTIPASH